jgi:hypothetical protein
MALPRQETAPVGMSPRKRSGLVLHSLQVLCETKVTDLGATYEFQGEIVSRVDGGKTG